ncbi:hypothetical protein [uncultured Clostridium sp.]|uniref:hypothetical protein n=1 Tax=uncultured Clostridium sp. TaxID=59620 RepID=UPI0025F90930|nr:hypothetical protein [uncultured Clostridium sp.]
MCQKFKCPSCNSIMTYKGKIEDSEENTYKHMCYCINCDSYSFIKLDEYEES